MEEDPEENPEQDPKEDPEEESEPVDEEIEILEYETEMEGGLRIDEWKWSLSLGDSDELRSSVVVSDRDLRFTSMFWKSLHGVMGIC
ncbi:hypothetical protein FNV43_RR11105 [Rhamnella rubrinervis]|uniref:Uncharacterized protein n=1 Tax=Rhamnella rubrinervis TaxID=2594499 RepID=A0A8K0MHJ6_9ROSA|nr:hypothetical protein FNV43_RR11105 [Rhamnella rubrinervis]